MNGITSSNATEIWQQIAADGVTPLQEKYLQCIDLLSSGTQCMPLQTSVNKACVLLQYLLHLEKEAQNCYIDAQLDILQNTTPASVAAINTKKNLRFHFFCSHASAEMGTHVTAIRMGLEQLGCDVWTDQLGGLDIDAFGMVVF